ncbi:alpha/beta fold hydrolase [Fulvivirga ligni]|uniref:alpha/beta fold hydrolase n=1 Tax=Fulvivirga ligni TaxID=2904246 RepID=UPI001F19F91B|nr:alpha/beta fold hydrolase [Fulvivirga ligni]UII19654.1 alpha/beta hydrolase [Fulvivirga ligni]
MKSMNQSVEGVKSGILNVDGASLYYETKGDGPLMLMIPGANGDHFIFNGIREILSETFTVATYDRRGFSGSELQGDQDYSKRINTDANDAAELIKYLTNEPAYVFASSSGALVSLQLMSLHPDLIKALIPHEPTALKYLNDTENWEKANHDLYDLYKEEGAGAAKRKFVDSYIPGTADGEIMKKNDGSDNPNVVYWFEHEVRQYPSTDFDTDVLRANKGKIAFCVGRESIQAVAAWPVTILASQFGTDVLYVPGGHLGYLLHPPTFAVDLIDGLKKRGLV